jgi:hypothetical protein
MDCGYAMLSNVCELDGAEQFGGQGGDFTAEILKHLCLTFSEEAAPCQF